MFLVSHTFGGLGGAPRELKQGDTILAHSLDLTIAQYDFPERSSYTLLEPPLQLSPRGQLQIS